MRGFNSDELLNRAVRGTVRVTKDGNFRWSFVSVPVDVVNSDSTYGLCLSSLRSPCMTATTSGGSINLSLRTLISDHAKQFGGCPDRRCV
jgi:hypothetical protein